MNPTPTRPRRRAPMVAASVLVASAALGAAACGGGGSDDSGAAAGIAASYIPSASPMYFEVTTDLEGPQWTEIKALGELFPAYPRVQQSLQSEFTSDEIDFERDVRPLLGERAAMAATSVEGVDQLTDADDAADAAADASEDIVGVFELAEGKRADAEAALTKAGGRKDGEHQGASIFVDADGGDTTTMAVNDEVLVIADDREQVTAALDAHAAGGDATLAGTDRFTTALGKLPQDVFGQMYVDVGALVQTGADAVPELAQFGMGDIQNGVVAASLMAEPEGLRIKGVTTGVEEASQPPAFTPALTGNVPADALAYFEVADTTSTIDRQVQAFLAESDPETADQMRAFAGSIQQMLGVSLDQLKALGSGQQAFVALPAAGDIPGLAILAKVDDGAEATKTITALRDAVPGLLQMFGGDGSGAPAWKDVALPGGVTGWQLSLDADLGVVLAVSGDLVVIASTPEAARAVLAPASPLSDAADFTAGTEGMPGSVSGLSWVNITGSVEQAGRAGFFEDAPADVLPNLRPLRSAATWFAGGDEPTFESFVRISE